MKEGILMGAFKNAASVIQKRPFIILLFGIVTLFYYIIDYYNPIFSILFGFGAATGGDVFTGVIGFLQLLVNIFSDFGVLLKVLIAFICFVGIIALFIGFFFSGYFNIINNALEDKPKLKGEFTFGVRKYFAKVSLISFRALLISFLFIVFMSVATVPAIIATKSAIAGKTGFFIAAVFIDLLTLGVLFFGFMFFRIYIFFWYPASLGYENGGFRLGKRIADNCFWKVIGKFLAFDIVFFLFQFILGYLSSSLSKGTVGITAGSTAVWILNWLFKTVFFATFITYIFSAFKMHSEGEERT